MIFAESNEMVNENKRVAFQSITMLSSFKMISMKTNPVGLAELPSCELIVIALEQQDIVN